MSYFFYEVLQEAAP